MSSTATISRTVSTTDLGWRRIESEMKAAQRLAFSVSGSADVIGDFLMDDLNNPSAITAAFTYCG